MSTFKSQIEDQLIKNNWKIIKVGSTDDWWIHEVWEVSSIKRGFDELIILIFEVDPQFEGNKINRDAIWSINAFSKFPKNRLDQEYLISSIIMGKRKFNPRLIEFITDLDYFRIKKEKRKS